jgi:RluA family pseudouridine synthase
MSVANIAAYKFAPLAELKPLRERLLGLCKGWGLRGTILLSTEGINLFVAGPRAEIDLLVAELRAVPGLEDLSPKYSDSTEQPFNRMLVRIKKEIIAFGVEGIEPGRRTSPKLPAKTLKQWLDEGRPVTLLDTRNDYEVKLGTFKGAKVLDIGHFRQFPGAVARLPEELKRQPIVMFCTGGIRCEKAGPFMEREGFREIFQLDGGILKYFEEVGGDHYEGECFVFDQRVGVDPALRETGSGQCFACQSPLTPMEQRDPRYVSAVSCPYCFKSPAEKMAVDLAARNEAIRRAVTPLPAARPYNNRRPLNVPAAYDGRTFLDFLCGIFDHAPREEWLGKCREGRFVHFDGRVAEENEAIRGGMRFHYLLPETQEPEVDADVRILYEDEAILVLHKPAPLPMHPSGRFNKNTLQFILNTVYAPQKPRPAHRLDAATEGLVVCARTRHFARLLQPQFEGGSVRKAYLAKVEGHPPEDAFSCDAPIGTEPGDLGSREVDEQNGLPARTEFRVLRRNGDGTALLEARPLTGRTNQIRVHLWKLGFPVCGDPAYRPGGKLGEAMTGAVGAPPLFLLAWRLEFRHPVEGETVAFETARPEWAQ